MSSTGATVCASCPDKTVSHASFASCICDAGSVRQRGEAAMGERERQTGAEAAMHRREMRFGETRRERVRGTGGQRQSR